MNLRITRRPHFFLIILTLFSSNVFSQCFEIQSILVDACGGTLEGRNEMVRFKVGNAPLNINTLTVTWPNNSWQGIVQDATTAAVVTQLNADIAAAGGCGQILEPPGGILPANATAILVTSYMMTPSANSFGPLSETIYMIFQNSTTSTGHFANQSTTPLPNARTLVMNFVGSCSDIVVYDKSILTDINGNNVPADGATVNFTPAGVASYTNNGCKAPVPPFTIDAGPLTLTACAGSIITLNGAAIGQQSVEWSSPSGSFSSPASTTTNYTIPGAAGGTTIALTLQATNSCGLQITDVINLSVTTNITPDFATTLTLCSTDTAPTLAATSPNGITGTWNPAVISITTSANYIFTPNTGQCATTATLAVTITPETIPDFATALSLCSTDTAPALALTSPNGITGTWNPAIINTTTNGNYIFTPNAGQCAAKVTLAVNIPSLSYSISKECVDNKYLIKAVTESSSSNYNFSWFNEKGDPIGSDNETFDFTAYSKNYNDQLVFPLQFKVIVSSGSCEREQLFEIENNLCGVPNAVSPNGDGVNDTFDLTAYNVTTLKIYNRWGREVYDFQGRYDQQWHGQWKEGNILPTGTYYYIISSDNGDQKAGWVYLSY